MRSLLLTVCVVLGMSATAQDYVVYPNPTTGKSLSIKLSEPEDIDLWFELSQVVIIDSSGRVFYNEHYSYYRDGRSIKIGRLKRGVYIVMLFSSLYDDIETHKIVVK